MSISKQSIDDERLARRVHAKLMLEEEQAEAQEAAERERLSAESQRQQDLQQAQADARVVAQLKPLVPWYAELRAAVEKKDVEAVWRAHSKIQSYLAALNWEDPPWLSFNKRPNRRQTLCQMADLPAEREVIGLVLATDEAGQVLQVVLAGIVNGLITPNGIRC